MASIRELNCHSVYRSTIMCYRVSSLRSRILVECKFRGWQFIVNRGQNNYFESVTCQKAFRDKLCYTVFNDCKFFSLREHMLYMYKNIKDICTILRIYLLTYGAEPFLRSRQLCSYSRTSQHFKEPESSSPCSQEPSNGPYPQPDPPSMYNITSD
jgi:hypothetical protein